MIDEKNKKIMSGIYASIEELKASQIPSIDKKMNFLPEAVTSLSSLGVNISYYSIVYLLLAYVSWLLFRKSYLRLEKSYYNWLDKNQPD